MQRTQIKTVLTPSPGMPFGHLTWIDAKTGFPGIEPLVRPHGLHCGTRWYRLEEPCNPESIPAHGGCYVIYLDGRLSYIGQSGNLRGRFRDHRITRLPEGNIRTPWGSASKIVIKVRVTQKYGDWAMIELRLIHRLNPPHNRKITDGIKSKFYIRLLGAKRLRKVFV